MRAPGAAGQVVVTLEAFERGPYRRGPALSEALVVDVGGER